MSPKKKSKKTESFLWFKYAPGSLDDKTRELVLLSASAAGGCSG